MWDNDNEYIEAYDCTAEDHTDCDSNYCDDAYAKMVADEAGITSLDMEIANEYSAVHLEERSDDDWVGG